MKIYKNPTIEIRNFISESVVTASPATVTTLEEWQIQNPNGRVETKNINAMKVMEYTF